MNDRITATVAAAIVLFCSSAALADPNATSSPAPTASPQTAASLLAQAQIDAASGHNEEARAELLRAQQLDPTNLNVLMLLGDVEYRLEHYPAAEAAYKAVEARTPKDKALHNKLGGVFAAEGRLDDAIAEFRLSLPSQEGISNLIQVYEEEGKLSELEAEDQLEVDRAPADDPYSRFELATVLAAEKKYPEALDLFDQVLNLRPDFWQAHNGLGTVYGELGRYPDAIAQYKIAIDQSSSCYQCWMNWGVELINSGDPTGAVEKIQKAISINTQFGLAYMNLGVAYDALGNFQKAIELYQQAIAYDPHAPQVYLNLGSDYFEHGLLNLAQAAFIKGIAIHPRDSALHLALGYYYQQRGEYTQAIDQYKLAMAYDPSDPRAKTQLDQVEALMKKNP